jgi:uncharacterized membrane protein HdeD (DUF308 family)
MTRKMERRISVAMGIWQILDGLVTIIYFGFYILAPLSGKLGVGEVDQANRTINSSMFTLTCTFGALLIGLGILNLVSAKRYLKDVTTEKKFGLFLLGQGLFSYFVLDIPSMLMGICGGVVYFAKNKAVKQSKIRLS